ncbi:MAG: hypothetical protein A2Z35_06580 [Actinobacteria bacterium RBG_19FT_COMBO_36_27]|nr:MAG: hypothetical protein A2Z35_06580 [Actinobacteria bacterium RBG_19FT_COMBO_36_27]OHB73536.1 MAG: hypothetical protein A2W17_08395 [Planctomycetes bacterium RBG_16_41_13]
MVNPRVLQLIGNLNPAGAENVVVNLANGLKTVGFDVLVLSREGGSLLQKLDGVITHIIPKEKTIDLKYIVTLSKFISKNKIDIVHTHLFGNNFYGFCATLLTGRKVIFTIHGEDCFRSRKRLFFYRHFAPFASKVVTVSRPLYDRFIYETGIKKEKVSLIPNGIDTYRFQKKIDLTDQRKKLGIPLDFPIVGAVGNIKPVKGYDIFINAAVDVNKKMPKACFVIVGGVRQRNEETMKALRALVNEKKLSGNIYFLGERNNVENILPLFDVYVLPSRSEGTSIALLEAMAAERAIVATNVGGTPYIIESNKTGILVPPEDASLLSNAIIKLLEDKSLAGSLGKYARIVAEEKYSVDSMINQYAALYNEIIQ